MSLGSVFWGGMAGHYASSRASREATDRAASASDAAREARYAASDVERRLDKLSMVCMAMWSILQEKVKVTEEDLMERVKQIDLMDGEVDGKMKKRELAKCSQCGRIMSPRHPHCIYCGADKLNVGAFDDVL